MGRLFDWSDSCTPFYSFGMCLDVSASDATMTRTPEEAFRLAVDALGGEKVVGYMLKPDIEPALAGQWLSHCLSRYERHKLSLTQQVLILSKAKQKGAHAGFEAFAELCGYRVTAVLDPNEEMAQLARKALAASNAANELTQELTARMRAANLRIDP